MANAQIKLHLAGHYRGIEILMTKVEGRDVFVAWMDKFYSADSAAPLIELIDMWWTLRRN